MRNIRMLALIMALLLLVSCGSATDVNQETSPSAENTAPVETQPFIDEYGREIPMHHVPADLDFGGLEITFGARDEQSYTIDYLVEEEEGEIVNDAVYRRNVAVEEELGVKFSLIPIESTNTTSSEAVGDQLRKNVMADDASMDIVGIYQLYGASLAGEGMLYNLNDLTHIDLDKPWWNRTFSEELTYKNQLYFAVGSMNLSVTSSLVGIFFNQAKVIDYHGDYNFLYDLVYEGTWTVDKFTELVKDHYQDLNLNNRKDDSDYYGMMVKEDDQGPWTAAFEIRLCTKDGDGIPQLSYFSEKTVSAYEKLYTLYRDTEGIYFGPKTFDWKVAFANGQSMFATLNLGSAETHLREMEDGYGILPMPKYDEAQENYYNSARDNSNLTAIAVNTDNPEAAGAALELLNYYSYLWVTPAYYEVAMKTKYLADSDSANMFDMIVNNTIVDFGEINALTISGGEYTMDGFYSNKFRNLIRSRIKDIASNYAKFESTYKAGLASVLEQYDKLAQK